MIMGFSLGVFLLPVFQSLIAAAVFVSGKYGVSFLADKKSMEKRYKEAFERAISRFYADPDYAGNEARRSYDQYLIALKEDFKAVQDFNPQKGEYKKLLELFGGSEDQGDRNFYTPFFVHEKCMNGGLFRHSQHD